MERNECGNFGLGLLIGVAIGGALALLFAPRSGKETRQMIKEKAEQVGTQVKGIAIEAEEKIKEAAEEAIWKGQAALQAIKEKKSQPE